MANSKGRSGFGASSRKAPVVPRGGGSGTDFSQHNKPKGNGAGPGKPVRRSKTPVGMK